MAELKTKQTNANPKDFIAAIADEQKRKDSEILLKLFTEITGEQAKMWGTSIIGFGKYHYKSERSKQEGDWPLTGFSPRKQALTLYIMPGFDEMKGLLNKLGKHKTSVGCLYINKLENVDLKVLRKIIEKTVAQMRKLYKVK